MAKLESHLENRALPEGETGKKAPLYIEYEECLKYEEVAWI